MDVQATLLYRTLRHVDVGALVDAVNAHTSVDALKVVNSPQAGDAHLLLTNPSFHAVISINDEKVDPDLIEGALTAPIMSLKQFDYSDAISAHRKHVTVSVGDGPLHVSADVRAWMQRMGKHQDSVSCPIDHKLSILNAVTQVLTEHDLPELVYWDQSDMLFTPEEIATASDMLFPMSLVVSPIPVRAYSTTGLPLHGIRLEASDTFAGRTITVEPSDLPAAETLGIAMWLFAQKTEGRLGLEHGAKIEMAGFPTLYVRHEHADENDPKGRIVITQNQPDIFSMLPGSAPGVITRGPRPVPLYTPHPDAQSVEVAPTPIVPDAVPVPVAAQPWAAAPQAVQAVAAVAQPQPAAALAVQPQAVAAPTPVATQTAPAAQEPTPAPATPNPLAGALAGMAPAAPAPVAEAEPQPEAAPPTPPPEAKGFAVAPVAKGWANSMTSGAQDTRAGNQTFAPTLSSPADSAASLKPKLSDEVPAHHKNDAAAALVAKEAEKQEAQQKPAPAKSLASNANAAPTGVLRNLPVRAAAGMAIIFVVAIIGLVMSTDSSDGPRASVQADRTSFAVNTGPRPSTMIGGEASALPVVRPVPDDP